MPELRLIAKLGLDKTGFDAGINKATAASDSFGEKFSHRLGKGFQAGALAAALIQMGREAIQAGNEIDKLAVKLGTTSEEAQKLRLRDKLESDPGDSILFSDNDLSNLRVVERSFLKLKEIAYVIGTKLFFLQGPAGLLTSLARLTGFVSDKPPDFEPASEKAIREAQAKREANIQEQDELLRLEREAAVLNRQTRTQKLTDGGKLNELFRERLTLQKNLIDTDPDDIGTFMMKKRLAEVNNAIAIIETQHSNAVQGTELGRIGAFSGAVAAGAQETLLRDNVMAIKSLHDTIRRGIAVIDVKR